MAKENIYPYAVAKIRVYESRLITKPSFIQMAEAKSADECVRILSELGYNNGNPFEVNEFEKVLSEENAKIYELMKEVVPDENFIEVFVCKNDYHNLKVILKSEISGVDGEKYIVSGGLVPIEIIKKAVVERNYSILPKIMGEALNDAYDIYSKTQNGQYIDMVIDKACFKYMSEVANNSKNSFIIKYVEKLCDLTNIKSFMRVRKMKKSFENTFKNVFISGGTINFEYFRQAVNAENYYSVFKGTAYSSVCEAMDRSITEFEKLCDDYLMEYVKSAKYVALTLEPLIAYIYAKETEIKTVRIIMTSKINDIDSDTIKERLREAYV